MDLQLSNRRIVLTGATRGIGRACAETLAQEGAHLLLSARHQAALDALASELRDRYGVTVHTCACDITDDASVTALFDDAAAKMGGVDVLINNAAGRVPAGDFLAIDNPAWLEGWNQKLQAYIRCCRAVMPLMTDAGAGVIVNVVGTAARNPKASYMPVGISNAALINFTKSLADYGAPHGVRAVAVAPAAVRTDRWTRLTEARAEAEGKTPQALQAEIDATLPFGRMAEPDDIADVVCFVASARARHIAGSVVTVDGNATQGVFN